MNRLLGPGLITVLLALSACVHEVFNAPLTLSTKTAAAEGARRLGLVQVEKCDYVILIVPIIHDQKEAYEELLEEAKKVGGNALVDFQIDNKGFFFIPPLFVRACWQASGMAAST